MGDTTTSYVPRDYRRTCDLCGNLWNRSQLTRRRNWIFCPDCEDRGTRIIEEENDAIARQRPFRILPVPNPKPLLIDNLYNYIAEEGILFDFVLKTAPARTLGGASDPAAAAAAAAYLVDIVARGTRPAVWLASASSVAVTSLSYLLTQQTGSPLGPASTAADPRYGGFLVGGSYSTTTTIAAGLAFIKAYATFGTPGYLTAANRCATFLRHAQCGDINTVRHTVYPNGGAPYHVGGIDAALNDSTGVQSGSFVTDDGYALAFFAALSAVVGSSATYGDVAVTAFFTAATSATLVTMIGELAAFLEVGPTDSAHGDARTSPLSTTAPRGTYVAFLSDGSGAGSWGAPTTVTGIGIAKALAGLFAVNGADTVVASMLAWLAAIGPNAVNATPAANTPQQTLNGITGTFAPSTSPATSYTATAPFTEATGALYDLAALGVLAPVLSVTSAASLRTARTAVSMGVPWSTFYLDLKYLGLLGRGGLALQPHTTATMTVPDVLLAAQFGAVYRYSNP